MGRGFYRVLRLARDGAMPAVGGRPHIEFASGAAYVSLCDDRYTEVGGFSMVSAQQPDSSCGTNAPPERTRAGTVAPLLSVTAAARRLGVSRWTIWRMIADGELDAETVTQGGRVITRVRLPEPPPDNAAVTPRSRTAQLQEQVDRLTKTLERLTALLHDHVAATDSARAREILDRWEAYAPLFWKVIPYPPVVQAHTPAHQAADTGTVAPHTERHAAERSSVHRG